MNKNSPEGKHTQMTQGPPLGTEAARWQAHPRESHFAIVFYCHMDPHHLCRYTHEKTYVNTKSGEEGLNRVRLKL